MQGVLIGIIIFIAVLLFFRVLLKPMKLLFKLIINSAIGLVMLIAFNFLGGFIHIYIGINLLTILIAGILGFPGIILILLLQMIL